MISERRDARSRWPAFKSSGGFRKDAPQFLCFAVGKVVLAWTYLVPRNPQLVV